MFYIKENDEIVLADENLQKLLNTLQFMPQYKELPILETEENETVVDFKLMSIETAKEKKEQIEKEKISMLSLTAADVERALYKAFGKDFDDIILMVKELQPEGLDIKALKIELKANNFYRGNPYIDAIGSLLGITKEQLDEFFKTNDYTKLLPEIESEVSNA